MDTKYKAMVVKENEDSSFSRSIETMDISTLSYGDTLIQVLYSSLNYKDALSATGNKGVTKKYPHVPGIDAAGIIVRSTTSKLSTGDFVLVTGYDLGMNTHGGFSQYIRVPAEWIVKIPQKMTPKESMAFGTAGFTAALSVHKLITYGIKPDNGSILVTGATGGVGSMAVSILSKLGYPVTAVTGKPEAHEMLIHLGAKEIISREQLQEYSSKTLAKECWNGVIDTVGGTALESAIKSTKYGGCVTCCGNVASHMLSLTVYPFILRGVGLLGIDSVQCPMDLRCDIWHKLSDDWKPDTLLEYVNEISLVDLSSKIDLMLNGNLKGRTVINLEI